MLSSSTLNGWHEMNSKALKRVNRIGQDQETETIKFVNKDSKLDMAIYGRQGKVLGVR